MRNFTDDRLQPYIIQGHLGKDEIQNPESLIPEPTFYSLCFS